MHALHHFTGLLKLLEKLVDFLHRDPGARGDTALAACLDEVRIAPLLRRHRIDDAFGAADRLVDVLVLNLGRGFLKLRGEFVDEA